MTESNRRARNNDKLLECHPVFAMRLAAIIAELEADDLRPRIQTAYRSPEDQAAAVARGTSLLTWGYHQAQAPDGRPAALAADVIDDDQPLRPTTSYVLRLAAAARARRCETGIDWYRRGTAEKRAAQRAQIAAAVEARDWAAPVIIGWDPCHVQVADVSLADARRGLRPII